MHSNAKTLTESYDAFARLDSATTGRTLWDAHYLFSTTGHKVPRHRASLQRLIPLVFALRGSLMRLFLGHIWCRKRSDPCPVRTHYLRGGCFGLRLRINIAASTPASAHPAPAPIALAHTGASRCSGPARSRLLRA